MIKDSKNSQMDCSDSKHLYNVYLPQTSISCIKNRFQVGLNIFSPIKTQLGREIYDIKNLYQKPKKSVKSGN